MRNTRRRLRGTVALTAAAIAAASLAGLASLARAFGPGTAFERHALQHAIKWPGGPGDAVAGPGSPVANQLPPPGPLTIASINLRRSPREGAEALCVALAARCVVGHS